MQYQSKRCVECNDHLTSDVFQYSTKNFNVPLCISHQNWLRSIESTVQSTKEAVKLYFALKMRGIPAFLEKYDGYKTIDIAIPEVKVNIEVDGVHHNFNHKQAFADLQRTYHSFLKGYVTFRIPNVLIHEYLEDTADYLTEMLNARNQTKWARFNN